MEKQKPVMIITRGKRSSVKDYFENHFNFFRNTIDIIRKSNEILPNALEEYDKINSQKIQESINKLSVEEKKRF